MSLIVESLRGPLFGPIDLVVDAGDCATITGPSGAGKSLLLRAVADLDANQGRVCCGAFRRDMMSAPDWRRVVRYASAEAGWWAPTAAEHFAAVDREAAARLALPPDVFTRSIGALSTGERQRLALLRALEGRPACLLLDEPTAALDPRSTAAVESLLEDARAAGAILVLVTHDDDQAGRLATRRYRMAEGRLMPR